MSFLQRLFRPWIGTPGKPAQSGSSPALSSNPAFDVEYCEPLARPCACCGGTTITLNRLVKRGGMPWAALRIRFSENHPEPPALGLFGLGISDEESPADPPVAFALVLRPEGVRLVDATEVDWPGVEILGRKLSREEALRHGSKPELFRLVDELYLRDTALAVHFAQAVGGSDTPTC